MIKVNFKAYNTYLTDSLHQWDINQVLEVSGLNLTTSPEVHFSNSNIKRAIVRQASLKNGIVTVPIPNSLLQEPFRISAHIGIYEGDTFKVVEVVEIPVTPRTRPADYQITDADEELYSFKRLENMLANKADNQQVNARIDKIIAHNNDTEGNTELVDLRTDAGGRVHGSAGTAVRAQIEALRQTQSNPNLLDENTLKDGYLDATGAPTGKNDPDFCYYSDFIPVDSSKLYYWHVEGAVDYQRPPWVCLCTYDTNKTFLKRPSGNLSEWLIALEADVAFVRIAFRSHMLGRGKFEQSTYPTLIEAVPSAVNLAEVYPLNIPGYINAGGYINSQTTPGESGILLAEHFSRMMPVTEGDVYVFYNGATYDPWAAVCFYGADGLPMGRTTFNTGDWDTFTVTAPDGAVAMRYSARTYSQHTFICYKKTGLNDYMDDYLRLMIEHRAKVDPSAALVKAVAHRGLSTDAPENTLPAYRLAKRKGFNYAECDVAFTSDDVAVLLHDSTVDRTSNGSGNLASLTYGEVRTMDFGSWKGEEYIGTTIPTFEEFIALCRAIGLKPYVEVKAGTEAQIKGLVDTVIRYGMRDATTWISFSATSLGYIKDADDKARLGYVVDAIDETVIATAQSLQTGKNDVFIDCSAGNAAAGANLCIAARIPLEVWTVNDEGVLKGLPSYVSGVTSDKLIAENILYRNNI